MDISQTLKYRVKELRYEDDKGLLEEVPGYDISLPIRGFKAIKHGKSVLTAIVSYEIEKKIKGKWLRLAFTKKHDHVFRVVPPIDFRITADQQIFRKYGEVNQTKVYAKAVFAGKRIKIGKTYRHKGYDFKILSLKWDPKVGSIANNDSGDPVYQIPIDQERLTRVGVSGTVEIIDRNRNIDIVEVIGETLLDFAVLDPQVTVSLNPGVNPETIAGVYEYFKIENINVVIPGIEFEKDIKPGDGLELTTLFGIPLKLNFTWALYENNPVFEAENQFEYGENVDEDWGNANLAMKFKIDKMEFDQVQGLQMKVIDLKKVIQGNIDPNNFTMLVDSTKTFILKINADNQGLTPNIPLIIFDNYVIEIDQITWQVNESKAKDTDMQFEFVATDQYAGKDVTIHSDVLISCYKKADVVIPSKNIFKYLIELYSSGNIGLLNFTDSTYPDNNEDNPSSLGYEEWKIQYKFYPDNFKVDSVIMTIYDKNGQSVLRKTTEDEEPVIYKSNLWFENEFHPRHFQWDGTWFNPKTEKIEYINPENSPYEIEMLYKLNGFPVKSNRKTIFFIAKSFSCKYQLKKEEINPNHLSFVDSHIKELDYSNTVHPEIITKAEFLEKLKEMKAFWYSIGHGHENISTKIFDGIWFKNEALLPPHVILTPDELDNSHNYNYSFVFFNCCLSADPKSKLPSQFINILKAKTYIGWKAKITNWTVEAIGIQLIKNLNTRNGKRYTVEEAMNITIEQATGNVYNEAKAYLTILVGKDRIIDLSQ